MFWAICGSAHADWAVLGEETGVTLIGAVSDDAASGEPNGAHFEATCIKGGARAGLLSFASTHTPAAAKIKIADKVPAAYRLIIDGDEVARVSSGPTKMSTVAGTLGYTFIWSVRLMSMIAKAQKEIKMVFDGDPARQHAAPAKRCGASCNSASTTLSSPHLRLRKVRPDLRATLAALDAVSARQRPLTAVRFCSMPAAPRFRPVALGEQQHFHRDLRVAGIMLGFR